LLSGAKVNGFLFGTPVLSAKLSADLSFLLDADPATQANIDQLIHLAQSITFD